MYIAHGDTLFEADRDDGLMIISNETPVPVELSSFIANYSGNYISLSWETATEINNYGFKIERMPSNPSHIVAGQRKGVEKLIGKILVL